MQLVLGLVRGSGVRSPPMTDEPPAGVLPAASPRRRAGQGVVDFAVGLAGNRTAAKAKTSAPRIAVRPAAGPRGERDDRLGSSELWVGEGGNLGASRGRLFQRRRGREGSRRLRFGAAVGSGGDSNGDPLDLVNRHRAASHEAEQNVDAAGDAAIAVLPAPDTPRTDTEQVGDAVLCEAERVECLAEFGPDHRQVAGHDDVALSPWLSSRERRRHPLNDPRP